MHVRARDGYDLSAPVQSALVQDGSDGRERRMRQKC